GIKPLYYVNVGSAKQPKLIFASEIKALLATGLFKPEPNDRQIYRYLRFRIHEDEPETFFKNVHKLMPGEMMTVDAHGNHVERYTNVPETLLEVSQKLAPYNKTAAEEYKERLKNAIRMRLVSEVPVGTCLSGGLDSSTTALVINQLLNEGDQEAQAVG